MKTGAGVEIRAGMEAWKRARMLAWLGIMASLQPAMEVFSTQPFVKSCVVPASSIVELPQRLQQRLQQV